MEGRAPYRIYDPGGRKEAITVAAFERLVEENALLKEKMKGIKCLGELMEESHVEASKLRQKAEELVKDNEMLKSSLAPNPFSSSLSQNATQVVQGEGCDQILDSFVVPGEYEMESPTATKSDQKSSSSGTSSEFEIVPPDEKRASPESRNLDTEQQNENSNLLLHLQRLENSLSIVAEKPDRSQLFAHLGHMALEFNRLACKVHKNEQKTSILQTLCEQLRQENEDLRRKLEQDLGQRNLATEKLRYENLELKKMLVLGGKEGRSGLQHVAGKDEIVERARQQENVQATEKATCKDVGPVEKKVKALEHQRNELLEVNKQWDQHFRSMKQQYEQKITTLRKKLADSQKVVAELEEEREQKRRDFDRKLLLAKSKIEAEQEEKENLTAEVNELKEKNKTLQDQLTPVSRQREYQEKEIHRLNKALEEALNVQASAPLPPVFTNAPEIRAGLKRQELLTQMELLKQQVKIFEEDFQRERSDRERMNEEKEELKQQLEQFQSQMSLLNTQLRACKEDNQREKEEKEKLRKLLKQQKQVLGERYPGTLGPICPPYQFPYAPPVPHTVYPGFEDWQILYPPTAVPAEHPQSEYQWRPPCPAPRNQTSQGAEVVRPHPMEPDPTGLGLPKIQRQQ
ncbi:TNFAIP3-interacting protein 1 isoform X2 [Microcaecilia unicolor]|uniref:TNFAIP3-interacting protein 1 n=1 Tax=Microcaecilia unicolor TaxID=1415580 RepID=A0A6P7YUT0_9AMPH|nr:TNFAIP3-interacting protein 1 isoform X2 [Microcaecilia unicolor]